jgi:hypothetical protein
VLVRATGSATELMPTPLTVPYTDITAAQIGPLDTNGVAYKTIAEGAIAEVTSLTGKPLYATEPGAGPYRMIHEVDCIAPGNTNLDRTTIGIGETVTFNGMPDITKWSLSGQGLLTSTQGSGTTFLSARTPGDATVTVTVENATPIDVLFHVISPSGISATVYTNIGLGTPDANGGQMGAHTQFKAQVLPTSVSFGGLLIREVPNYPTVTWPNGTNETLNYGFSTNGTTLGCDSSFMDRIQEPLRRISLLFNGTNYVDFSFSITWADQYQNDQNQWVDFPSMQTTTKFKGSDKTCQEIYQGASGSWQGPYAQ